MYATLFWLQTKSQRSTYWRLTIKPDQKWNNGEHITSSRGLLEIELRYTVNYLVWIIDLIWNLSSPDGLMFVMKITIVDGLIFLSGLHTNVLTLNMLSYFVWGNVCIFAFSIISRHLVSQIVEILPYGRQDQTCSHLVNTMLLKTW